ncbi:MULTISPECIES: 2-hydroxyacid dehydrogenase [Bacillaceae]|uniref:Oxidoreductase n=1 Tax=Alkalicoccobacillus plakortidis TaxID=444060 RepID=A0A9D5DR49_9BACI|nr:MULTISPECIES: 2-hydroxyacid dehydrogenase [Bacillaceae]KQL56455.1 oxidoreductase [Alkalicoccobacillus plakortidis]
MKCLAIADLLISEHVMKEGLASLEKKGIELTIRKWHHNQVEDLQKDNLLIEQTGSNAVLLPHAITHDIHQYEIILTQFAPLNRFVLAAARKVTLIGVLRGGIENIDVKEAEARGIKILNTPGRNARSVAEFTVGMIIAEMRNIGRSHASIMKGNWQKDFANQDYLPELGRRTVGIIGFGHIGQLVAKFLSGFNTRILFYDPFFKGQTTCTQVELEELLRASDVVSLHSRLTAETKGMLGYEQFKKMKQTAILINTARSGLVKEGELIRALRENIIAGAALDTFDHEPITKDSPLLSLKNVTLTAHLAGSTIDAFHNSPTLLAERIHSYLDSDSV